MFSMTLNGWTGVLTDCGVMDDENCKLSDMDRTFIACNVEIKGEAAEGPVDNNLRTLEYFEFLEGLVRVAPYIVALPQQTSLVHWGKRKNEKT